MLHAAIAMILAQGAAQPAAPLQPAGQWTVDYAAQACILTHDYTGPKGQLGLAIRSWPLSEDIDLAIIERIQRRALTTGTATLTFSADKIPLTKNFTTSPSNGGRTTLIVMRRPSLQTMEASTEVTVALGKAPPIVLPLDGIARGLAALKKCNDDLQANWGVDPAEVDNIQTHAVAIPYVPTASEKNAYPEEPANAQLENEYQIISLYLIGTDGKVSQCKIMSSGGNAETDRSLCENVSAMRFTPAVGRDGKPVAEHRVERHVIRTSRF
ncbi:energy transducer TonB [Sphingomonas sp.]|uniref:energy transducer TonB n=1 Tax=Sphingomonas sp. TaxID=28214 RepID=UPI003D6D0AAA